MSIISVSNPTESLGYLRATILTPPEQSFLVVTLKPCPWCNKTPAVDMYMGDESWQWKVRCGNSTCAFKPEGRYVVIRKTQRFHLYKIAAKLELLCSYWNAGSLPDPYERIQIPLLEWCKWMKKQGLE